MSQDEDHEISYIADEGQVKFYLRRPVYLYVPSELVDSGDYDPLLETEPPAHSLELQWAYGYRGKDARNNVLLLSSGELLYFTAAVAVVYNIQENTQRHYIQHTDDIKCIALHPDGETVATGQVKGVDDEEDAAHIRVWNATTLETLHVFGVGEIDRAVSCLAFSTVDGGALLAATDDAPEPKLSVWEWQDESKKAEVKCSGDPVLAIKFTQEEEQRVVTTGKNSIMFWSIDDDSLKKRTGIFGGHSKPKYITALCISPDGQTISGDSNGSVIFWEKDGNEIDKIIPNVHEGSVFSITLDKEGGYITSGKDLNIKRWDDSFSEVKATTQLSEEIGGARAVIEIDDSALMIGTVNNIIAKGGFEDEFEEITKGALGELWGVATHPSADRFLTGSYDGVLAERDSAEMKLVWAESFENGVQSVCYSPGGEVIVAGFDNGAWKVFDSESKEVIHEGQNGDEPIQVARFSPDGTLLALGSRDNNVYVFEVADEFKEYTERGVCSGHSSFIRSLDFSSDGEFLQTNSGDYELLYWRLADCSHEPDSAELRNTEWATRTCLLCFQNFGVWPMGVDGTDLNAVSGAHSKPLVVTADDFGKVKLFSSIIHYAYAANKPYQGHSSHVTGATFNHDDSKVISIGGNDGSVLQWNVKDQEE